MGGKQKQARRTKGNTRPSNSGRTAELLAASGIPAAGAVGFDAFSSEPGYVPILTGSEDADGSVDGDFRMTMRKMSKRDVTTKLKAVQEFGILCKEKDPEVVKGALPFWPRLYNKLSMDCDRRVREATQQAHHELIQTVKKGLAPHLRAIMGVWFVAQQDPHAPAAAASKLAFQAAFPPSKQTEALVYCCKDITKLLRDNILHQTAQTLSDPETTPPEEMEAKYNRVVSSSLLALKSLLLALADTDITPLTEFFTKLLSDATFWKLVKHPVTMIRSAWFSLVTTICQTLTQHIGQFAPRLCPAVFNSLDESDPVVSPLVWEAALCLTITIDDCWQHVNARKAVLPKLWAVLKDGGGGNAVIIYSNLLPFLSKIPSKVMGDGPSFYNIFFTNIRQGLLSDKVQASPSECNAVVTAFMECIRFVVVHKRDMFSSEDHLAKEIINEQVLPVLMSSLEQQRTTSFTTEFYRLLGSLLSYLQKNNLTALESSIWDTFTPKSIETIEYSNPSALARLSNFFKCLHNPNTSFLSKSSSKVRFSGDAESDSSTLTNESGDPSGVTEFSKIKHKTEMIGEKQELPAKPNRQRHVIEYTQYIPPKEVIVTLTVTVLKKLSEFSSTNSVQLLEDLMKFYICDEFMVDVLVRSGKTDVDVECACPIIFFNEFIVPLSKNLPTHNATNFCKSLVGITFTVIRLMSKSVIPDILNKLLEADSVHIVTSILDYISKEPSPSEGMQTWLKGKQVETILLHSTQQLCEASLNKTSDQSESDIDAYWALLSFALTTNDNFESPISMEATGSIIEVLLTTLPKFTSKESSMLVHGGCVTFISDVADIFFRNSKGCWKIPAAEELLFSLFIFTSTMSNSLPASVVEKVDSTLKNGVRVLIKDQGGYLCKDGFLYKAATFLRLSCMSLDDSLPMESILMLEKAARLLITTVVELPGQEDLQTKVLTNPLVESLLDLILPNHEQWAFLRKNINSDYILRCYFQGNMTIPETCVTEKDQVSKRGEINGHGYCALFVSKLLQNLVSSTSTAEKLEVVELGHYLSVLSETLYASVYCGILAHNDVNGASVDFCGKLDGLLDDFLPTIVNTEKVSLLNSITKTARTEGRLWALTLAAAIKRMEDEQQRVETKHFVDSLMSYSTVEELHTLQALLPLLTQDQIDVIAQCALIKLNDGINQENVKADMLSLAITTRAIQLLKTPSAEIGLSAVSAIHKWKDNIPDLFLFICNKSDNSPGKVTINVEMIHLMRTVVDKMSQHLTRDHWDIILCSLVSWIQSLEDVKDAPSSLNDAMFSCALGEFLYTVGGTMEKMSQEKEHIPEVVTEWKEFFADTCYIGILPLFINLAESSSKSSLQGELAVVLIAKALELITCDNLLSCTLPPTSQGCTGGVEKVFTFPAPLESLLTHLCPLLTSPQRSVQITAYKLLLKITPHIAKACEEYTAQLTEGKEEEDVWRPFAMHIEEVLVQTSGIVETVLAEHRVGEFCLIQPDTATFTCTMAYLFTWSLVMEVFNASSSQVRSEYATYLKNKGLMEQFLGSLFCFMPENAAAFWEEGVTFPSKHGQNKTMFTLTPALSVAGKNTSTEIQHFACQMYLQAVRKLPALVRQWWKSQDKRVATLVDKFTSKFATSVLCQQEIQAVQATDCKFDNMTIKARPSAREVVATYTIDNVSVELVIQLPDNHPLGTIVAETGKRVGVNQAQWRNWMLQLTTFLMQQNGSIIDGLTLWKQNLDKKFEGVEECFICYYVLHGSNCQLPQLSCRTCKKKFHSACLYKWFSTSNNSTCPLCRNPFFR